MTDGELVEELKILGMDESSYRALPLLPLVRVAWADGSVQEAEERLILELARERYHLGTEGERVLRNWLRYPPSALYARRGQAILLALCGRTGFDALSPDSLVDVLALSHEVAKAAGGFFGFGAIQASEADAIDEIAGVLQIPGDRRWVSPEDETFLPADADRESDGPPVAVTISPLEDPESPCGTLIYYDEDRGDRICPIGPQGITIGRARENPVRIHYDAQVSRLHCKILCQGERFYATDLGSLRGTLINGERIVERRLFGGETLQIGSTSFFFQLG